MEEVGPGKKRMEEVGQGKINGGGEAGKIEWRR
jgi:hypothetical protein